MQQVARPTLKQWKWLFLMSVFGFLSFLFSVLAIRLGASPGDVASLQSVNVVVAAVLGRLFLNERLGPIHLLSLLCSVGGAVLISKPEFIFGGSDEGGAQGALARLGLAFAPMSGFFLASAFVCTRKMGTINMWILPACTMAISIVGFFVMPYIV